MTPDDLRALADALRPMAKAPCFDGIDIERAADYLRAQADAQPVAWLHDVVQDGDEPDQALSFYRDSFPLEGVCGFRSIGCVPLYLHPAPAVPQSEPSEFKFQPRAGALARSWDRADALAEPKREPTGAPYGIIDPDYGRAYTIARKIAREEGYAIGLHGSFTRDLDLIAVPWAERACEAEHLIRRIVDATGLQLSDGVGVKPHGRRAWTLLFPAFGDPRFVDLSVMPRIGGSDAE